MVQVVIAHVIGTISLLLLFSIVGGYSVIYYSSLQTQTVNTQLQDISSHVSYETTGLVSLNSVSSQNGLSLIKEISIPNNFGETFSVTLVQSQGTLMVVAQGTSPFKVFGESSLPWAAGGNVLIFNGTNPGINDPRLTLKTTVDSGATNMVIWSFQENGVVTVGLGTFEG